MTSPGRDGLRTPRAWGQGKHPQHGSDHRASCTVPCDRAAWSSSARPGTRGSHPATNGRGRPVAGGTPACA